VDAPGPGGVRCVREPHLRSIHTAAYSRTEVLELALERLTR